MNLARPPSPPSRGGVRVLVASFRFADWTIIALGVAFLVPLVVRTVAAL